MKFGKKEISGNELYSRCLEGDKEHLGYLYQYILAIVKKITWADVQEIEDRTHFVWLHIREKLKNGDIPQTEDFYAYVFITVRNKIRDLLRAAEEKRKKLTRSLDEMGNPVSKDNRTGMSFVSEYPTQEVLYEKQLLSVECRKALERITPARRRKVVELYLRYLAGDPKVATYKDMAKILKLKHGTVASIVHRELKKLRKDSNLMKIFIENIK